jgi:predicted DNA-binding protein
LRNSRAMVGVMDMGKDTTIRIDQEHKDILKELSQMLGKPASGVLQEAIKQYRKTVYMEDLNRAYARLRADEEAWAEELKERELWENTLGDGLD